MFNRSDSSDANALHDLNALLTGPRPAMNIHLDNHYTNKIYTSSSTVAGHISIGTPKQMFFDQVQILLMGTCKTRMDAVHSPSTTTHTFLKLEMPIPRSSYPTSQVFEPGQTYIFPFNFVIPEYLTVNACNHDAHDDPIHDHHLMLPPTMGSWGALDDFSPDMAKVEYSIVARVLSEEDASEKRLKLLEAQQPIKVLPASAEQAPLHITPRDKMYKMSKTKSLKRSILSSKTGKITVSAGQPGAVMLSPDGRSALGTKAQIDLRFEPASSHAVPPAVAGVASKITAVSYYSAGPINVFPHLGEWDRCFGAEGRGSYSSTTSLSAMAVDKVKWRENLRQDSWRRGSCTSDTSCDSDVSNTSVAENESRRGSQPEPSSSSSSKNESPVYYTTKLQVPVQLPQNKKMFIPSFHSCILSRVYVLWLTVSLSVGGSTSHITLGLPLQVGVEGTHAAFDPTGLPTFETAVEEAEADEFFRPRRLTAPDIHFARSALPTYGDLQGRQIVMAN